MTLDTKFTDAPVCPYCGNVEHDAWEINFGPDLEGYTEVSCGSCGEDYFCSRNVSVSYSTRPIAALAAKEE